MGKKLRKFNRDTHRDLGYFFVALIFVYSISGIAINHINDWNPSYIVDVDTYKTSENISDGVDKAKAKKILKELDISNRYLKHYSPSGDVCKIFVKNGSVLINLQSGEVKTEIIKRRTLFHAVNWLHYNPNKVWTWISDIFAGALIILAISGMFILKGKNGLKWRGTILIVSGILLPIIFVFLFY